MKSIIPSFLLFTPLCCHFIPICFLLFTLLCCHFIPTCFLLFTPLCCNYIPTCFLFFLLNLFILNMFNLMNFWPTVIFIMHSPICLKPIAMLFNISLDIFIWAECGKIFEICQKIFNFFHDMT